MLVGTSHTIHPIRLEVEDDNIEVEDDNMVVDLDEQSL